MNRMLWQNQAQLSFSRETSHVWPDSSLLSIWILVVLPPVYSNAYSGEVDQGSGVMPISVPVDSDQVIGAERRWQSDCVGSDRNRQERSWK
jgi:hypothetical protein